MSLIDICCGEVIFQVNSEEIKCSKFLSRIAGDHLLVSSVSLPEITPEIMSMIIKFMKMKMNPPKKYWINDFLEECGDFGKLLTASFFLEIDDLTNAIIQMTTKMIEKSRTVEEVFLSSNIR